MLHVFSSQAAPFQANESYSKFAAFALLHHNGDFAAAAKALAALGYGSRSKKANAIAAGDGITIVEVIRDYFRTQYDPTFKRGSNIWARLFGREVTRAEACAAPTSEIIPELLGASDFPQGEAGPKRSAVPGIFRQWATMAWNDLLKTLSDEADSPEVADNAAEQFHAAVSDALMTIESFAYRRGSGKDERFEIQRRSLIDWCRLFAKPGPWQSVRLLNLWCRLREGKLEVGIHQRLFGQIRRGNLGPASHRRFKQLCELYGVGMASRTKDSRFVVLTPEFVADLLNETTGDGSDDGNDDGRYTRTRAKEASPCPSSFPSPEQDGNDATEEP